MMRKKGNAEQKARTNCMVAVYFSGIRLNVHRRNMRAFSFLILGVFVSNEVQNHVRLNDCDSMNQSIDMFLGKTLSIPVTIITNQKHTQKFQLEVKTGFSILCCVFFFVVVVSFALMSCANESDWPFGSLFKRS